MQDQNKICIFGGHLNQSYVKGSRNHSVRLRLWYLIFTIARTYRCICVNPWLGYELGTYRPQSSAYPSTTTLENGIVFPTPPRVLFKYFTTTKHWCWRQILDVDQSVIQWACLKLPKIAIQINLDSNKTLLLFSEKLFPWIFHFQTVD